MDKTVESSKTMMQRVLPYSISVVAVLWSLFHLYISCRQHVLGLDIWDSVRIRSVHLGFALLLSFCLYPLSKKRKTNIVDLLLGLFSGASALYLAFEYKELVERAGDLNRGDIIVGTILFILLLEATRRVLGWALPTVALLFTVWAFGAEYLGSILPAAAFANVSFFHFIDKVSLSTEGIYGIPLRVSATVIFLFVLFGAMLDRAGGGQYFIDLALSVLGPFRGGPAKAAVIGSGLTGMISGSSIANIVTTGTFSIPLMKRVGYPAKKAAAIEVAASTDGQLAPPIMGAAAFIIAETLSVNYLTVIKAAAIPAFVSYATLFYITHLEACKLGLRGIPRQELPSFFTVLWRGSHFLLPIGVLLYLLIIERRSAGQAIFYAASMMGIILLLQRPIQAIRTKGDMRQAIREGIRDLFTALASGGRNMIVVAVACAAAGIVVGIIPMGPSDVITTLINNGALDNVFLLLILTAITSLLIGMGLPTTATYIVVAALIAQPIVMALNPTLVMEWRSDNIGYHEILGLLLAAHLFCFYFGILADDTPPVGLAAYAAAAIAKSPPIATGIQSFLYDCRTAILPFMFMFNTELILYGQDPITGTYQAIERWDQGILIFVMACLGSFAFAAAIQGWLLTKNKVYELPLLLGVTVILMQPGWIAVWLGIPWEQRYWIYAIGVLLFTGIYCWQWWRRPGSEVSPS